MLNDRQRQIISDAEHIAVLQAENPDGDSLGSALALEDIFSTMGKSVDLHCPVQIPTYLHYVSGWDRVTDDFPVKADIAIVVDTSAKTLMSKTIDDPAAMNFLSTHPVIVFDHHAGVEPDLPFDADYIISNSAVSTSELLHSVATSEKWPISPTAATDMFISIQADSLGLSTPSTTADSYDACADLVRLGAVPSDIEESRRELMKKSPRILSYKGQLIERIEYYNDGRTAFIHIPFDEIHEYSNEYNPTMLVMDEMRLVTGVDVSIGIKTYPDGKLTGKIRSNIPVSNLLAKTFGGDGHAFAAGFRIYEDIDEFLPELIKHLNQLYDEYDRDHSESESDNATVLQSESPKRINGDNSLLGNFRVKNK